MGGVSPGKIQVGELTPPNHTGGLICVGRKSGATRNTQSNEGSLQKETEIQIKARVGGHKKILKARRERVDSSRLQKRVSEEVSGTGKMP